MPLVYKEKSITWEYRPNAVLTWQDPSMDLSMRRHMLKRICYDLQQKQLLRAERAQFTKQQCRVRAAKRKKMKVKPTRLYHVGAYQQIYRVAQSVEKVMYHESRTRDEYMNLKTLEKRIGGFFREMLDKVSEAEKREARKSTFNPKKLL